MLLLLEVADASETTIPREALDAIWDEHMLTGSSVRVFWEASGPQIRTPANLGFPVRPDDLVETAAWNRRGIEIQWLREGFWRNGGWVVRGGLLDSVPIDGKVLELYGKATSRRASYFPFRLDPWLPDSTDYEFFLLHRVGVPRAHLLRQWRFGPEDVDLIPVSSEQKRARAVKGSMRFDPAARSVTVIIIGLKQRFEESMALSALVTSQRPN
jgi:hypothetical protein